MRIPALIVTKLVVLCAAMPAFAHEFWIAPEKYQVEIGDKVTADFVNGENFGGGVLAWFDNRVDMAAAALGAEVMPIEGRLGDVPAITVTPETAGLLVIVSEAAPSSLTYRAPEKFEAFVTHKDLNADLDAQTYPFKEAYSRHAKALVHVGNGEGQDRALGMKTEFVALENPYTDDMSDGLDLLLLYQGAPRADAQIEVFQKSPEGDVEITLYRSDQSGRVTLPVRAGHRYLVDSVVLRRPAPETLERVSTPKTVQWETLWAALTFAIPD